MTHEMNHHVEQMSITHYPALFCETWDQPASRSYFFSPSLTCRFLAKWCFFLFSYQYHFMFLFLDPILSLLCLLNSFFPESISSISNELQVPKLFTKYFMLLGFKWNLVFPRRPGLTFSSFKQSCAFSLFLPLGVEGQHLRALCSSLSLSDSILSPLIKILCSIMVHASQLYTPHFC